MIAMAKEKPNRKVKGASAAIMVKIDPELRAALDAWISKYNAEHDHRATITSVVEAALRRYIAAGEGKP